MTEPFLKIENIRKEYGSVVAVHNVDLNIDKGEFMTFLGPSGSGKSTTLYILAGFENPTRGDIKINGQSLLSTPSNKRNVGMVFQRYTLFPNLTVGENIAFPLKVRKRPKAEITEKVRQMLKLVRLEGFEDRRPSQMSGGQQQRVALARALAYDPPVLLMDEPLSALDKKLREEIQYEIRRIHHQTEVTILYVTHDQEEALRLSDRISVFSQGRIDQVGTGQELYADPATRFVAEFIGDSDFIACEILEHKEGLATIRCGDSVIENVPAHNNVTAGAKATLMLRPERITLHETATSNTVLEVIINDINFLGNNVHVATKTNAGQPIAVRLSFGDPAIAKLALDKKVYLAFEASNARVFNEE